MFFFFFKQKTAYEITHSDWSSDVCSSDLDHRVHRGPAARREERGARAEGREPPRPDVEEQRARRAPRVVAQQLDGAALLERREARSRLGLLGQAVHDLDAGEVPLVDRPVVALAREGLLVDPALARPVEEAAVA